MTAAGFVLIAWPDHVGFFLAPLALLLLVSRPRTLRERVWLALLVVWAAVWILQPGGIAQATVRATAVIAAGMFVSAMLWRPVAPLRAMVIAATIGVGAVAAWGARYGLDWPGLQHALTQYGMDTYRELSSGTGGAALAVEPDRVRETIRTLARFYPGLTFAAALAGLGLAWGIYHRVAAAPLGSPPGPFRGFRFLDQAIWLVIAALATVLAPLPPPLHTVAGNILLVMAGLYLVRGAAVVSAVVPPPGWLVGVVVGVAALVLAPLAGTSLVVIGIADTWIDFRRRLPPAAQGAHS